MCGQQRARLQLPSGCDMCLCRQLLACLRVTVHQARSSAALCCSTHLKGEMQQPLGASFLWVPGELQQRTRLLPASYKPTRGVPRPRFPFPLGSCLAPGWPVVIAHNPGKPRGEPFANSQLAMASPSELPACWPPRYLAHVRAILSHRGIPAGSQTSHCNPHCIAIVCCDP